MGKAISLMSEQDNELLEEIVKYTNKAIPLHQLPMASEVQKHRKAFNVLINTHPQLKQDKGLALKEEITKLHINAGKKTKMRAGDVVGAICNIPGVSAEDIGVISIVDVSTFVEILNNKGEQVFQALQSLPIKGRVRKVNKANVSEYERKYLYQKQK